MSHLPSAPDATLIDGFRAVPESRMICIFSPSG